MSQLSDLECDCLWKRHRDGSLQHLTLVNLLEILRLFTKDEHPMSYFLAVSGFSPRIGVFAYWFVQ